MAFKEDMMWYNRVIDGCTITIMGIEQKMKSNVGDAIYCRRMLKAKVKVEECLEEACLGQFLRADREMGDPNP